MVEEWITSLYLNKCIHDVLVVDDYWQTWHGQLQSHGWGLRKMLHFSTRQVSPSLLLCVAPDAKCYVGMSQESGCPPSIASHAVVSLPAERSPEMDSAFLVMGNDSVVWDCSQLHVRELMSALNSAMTVSWMPEEALPVVLCFLLFTSDVGGFNYPVPQTHMVLSWYLGFSNSSEIHPHFHIQGLKG